MFLRGAITLLISGCVADVDAPILTIEPSTIDLVVVLGQPPPTIDLHVRQAGADVTDKATWTLQGAELGGVDAGRFTSDGLTGGTATISVQVGGGQASVLVSTRIESARYVDVTADEAT